MNETKVKPGGYEPCTFGFAALSDKSWPVLIDHICETGKPAGKLVVLLPTWAGKDSAELIDPAKFTPSRDAAQEFSWDGGWDLTWGEWGESQPIWSGNTARCLNFWPEDLDVNSPANILSDASALISHRSLGTEDSGLTESMSEIYETIPE